VGEGDGLYFVKPMTYMNRSGFPVRCLLERESGDPKDVMIVYDDVNLPLGRLRIRGSGSPGGHRGMESIVQNLRSPSVPRLRLGVGAPEGSSELVDHVLSSFEEAEAEEVRNMITRAADAVDTWLDQGIEAAMNQFNGPANDA
jgi:PTH1 family peptidyl-tRNA hydrolase